MLPGVDHDERYGMRKPGLRIGVHRRSDNSGHPHGLFLSIRNLLQRFFSAGSFVTLLRINNTQSRPAQIDKTSIYLDAMAYFLIARLIFLGDRYSK